MHLAWIFGQMRQVVLLTRNLELLALSQSQVLLLRPQLVGQDRHMLLSELSQVKQSWLLQGMQMRFTLSG